MSVFLLCAFNNFQDWISCQLFHYIICLRHTHKIIFFLQMKPGIPLIGLPFCGWPPGVLSPSIAFSSPGLGIGFGLTDGNVNPFLLPNISTDESPAPQNEKPLNSAPCIVEVAKSVDYPSPRPIIEGKWKASFRNRHKMPE